MDPEKPAAPLDLGIYGRQVRSRVETSDIIAAVLSLIWVATVAGFWYFIGISSNEGEPGFNPMTFVMTMVSILLPIGLIWVASSGAKTARVMREESRRLQSSIDAMRHAYVSQQQKAGQVVKPASMRAMPDPAAAQQAEPAEEKPGPNDEGEEGQSTLLAAAFSSRREPHIKLPPKPQATKTTTSQSGDQTSDQSGGQSGNRQAEPTKAALARKPAPKLEGQSDLALDTPEIRPADPITIVEFIRAMNFPENEDDHEGFRTLRRALEDRDIAKMIRASQDILTLLSQNGIYMDDLKPDRPRAATWRRFAKGERGPAIAGLGGIRDRSCLALTSGRMKQDPVFRDAAHHFLRQFDSVLTEFEANATDQELTDMGETRTARAFMLLGRVAGTFD
ncbi:MAG: hypothetical protein KDA67_07690 [Rhodobacteraceae bacterium]|nr:hypothetical protein [Paracoccaceae bacterium]